MSFDLISKFVLSDEDLPQSALDMAATLMIDTVGVAALSDPQVADVLVRIALREDARYNSRFPAGLRSDVAVILECGSQFASGDAQARGGPEAPVNMTGIEQKFRLMAATFPDLRVAARWQMRERLALQEIKFSELAPLVRSSEEEHHA